MKYGQIGVGLIGLLFISGIFFAESVIEKIICILVGLAIIYKAYLNFKMIEKKDRNIKNREESAKRIEDYQINNLKMNPLQNDGEFFCINENEVMIYYCQSCKEIHRGNYKTGFYTKLKDGSKCPSCNSELIKTKLPSYLWSKMNNEDKRITLENIEKQYK